MMPALYEIASVFVLPSKGPGETWGLAVNEALANGKVVIVSDKCGCAADLVDDTNGYTFPAGNTKVLANILQLILADKIDFGEKALQSKNRIKKYSLTKLACAVENVVIHA